MSMRAYIRDIGRGKESARALTRDQAADLMGSILDQRVSDLELGAFCIAMRVKGETPQEMAGFWDAATSRIQKVDNSHAPTVVLPSYNGARKLPVLTPLLALKLAQNGVAVLIHTHSSEPTRVSSMAVLAQLGVTPSQELRAPTAGQVTVVPTAQLHPGLEHLLQVRQTLGLRNSAHSLVKLLAPTHTSSLLVTSYTHPEYLAPMTQTLQSRKAHAMLLRGTEGEPVADPRRCPLIEGLHDGQREVLQPAQEGSLATLPDLPSGQDIDATVRYTRAVLSGEQSVPEPIRVQVQGIAAFARRHGV